MLALCGATLLLSGTESSLGLSVRADIFRIILAVGVCMVCMHYFDLYDSAVMQTTSGRLTPRLMKVLGAACLVLSPVYYWYPGARLELNVFLVGILLAGILLLFWRRLLSALGRLPQLNRSAVLVGQGPLLASLLREVSMRKELGFHIVGIVHTGPEAEIIDEGLPDLGSVDDLPALVKRRHIGRVIVTQGDRRGHLPVEMLLKMKAHGVAIEDACDTYEAITDKVPLAALRPAWLLFSPGFRVSRVRRYYKRAGSVVLSLAGILVSLPLQLLIALAIKLDSRGSVIFKQERVGKDGRPFTLYKFRTMVTGADRDRPAQAHDSRCTRLGAWLRRTRLDELPQLFNILRGDMHLIGPRPFTQAQEEQLSGEIPFYTQRWTVRPGLTGWAQIHYSYCETLEDNMEKLAYDLFYIKNGSIGLDLVILLQTIKILLLGRGSR